jgi:hypothetical protein
MHILTQQTQNTTGIIEMTSNKPRQQQQLPSLDPLTPLLLQLHIEIPCVKSTCIQLLLMQLHACSRCGPTCKTTQQQADAITAAALVCSEDEAAGRICMHPTACIVHNASSLPGSHMP